jgi:cell division protein FtsW (lipid II flippase)
MGDEKNTKFEEYIETVCLLVKNKDVHKDIKLELIDHLETLKEDFMTSGSSIEEANDKAIAHMGEASAVGRQLNSAHKAKLDLKILIPVIAFSVFGLIVMYIIQTNVPTTRIGNMKIFQKSLIFYVIGIVLMVGLYFFDYRKLLPYSKYIYLGTLMLLVFSTFFGKPANGRAWLSIGNLNIDFIDISPFFLVVALAGIFQDWDWQNTSKFLIGITLMAVPGWFLLMNGISTMIIYLIACAVLMIVSRIKLYLALLPAAGIFLAAWLSLIMAPYRFERLLSFLNPEQDPSGSGYMYIQLRNAINSAGILGNSTVDIQTRIPELHTDFIFTYITSTFGWIAAAVIILLILAFILRMVHIANTAKSSYGKLLSAGFVAILSTQFILSIATSLGISPFFGVSLPFMSFGGSHIIMDMASAGITLSVYRRRNLSNAILSTKTS